MKQAPTGIAGYDPISTAGTCHYDADAGNKPIEFARRCLVHTKGSLAGQPLEFADWQQDIIRTLFGWVTATGTRRYRKAYIEIPRKNGKTTMLAAMACYVLFCDGEPGAECYCAASDADQASLLYSIAATMIRKNPDLDSICKIRDSVKRIIYKDSFLRAIPADERGSHGFNSHCNLKDELHSWPGTKGREFYDVLETGTASRVQPLDIDITTAGYDRHSICWQQHEYAVRVRDGVIKDASFLPVLYSATESDDWTSPEVWAKANPNLGVSVPVEYLERQCAKALKEPQFENVFRRLHLNQWTSQETRWLQMDKWRSCRVGPPIADGAWVTLGLDMSATTDLTALAICEERQSGYRIEWRYWLPADRVAELERRDGVPYRQWIKDGYLSTTPGATIDQRFIRSEILAVKERYNVAALSYDPWGMRMLREQLEDDFGLTCIECRQGMATLSAPSKELERAVIEGLLDHGGNPISDWHAESSQVKTDDNGNIRPVKPDRNDYGKKIDGIVAAVMAIHAASVTDGPFQSIYSQAGNLEL